MQLTRTLGMAGALILSAIVGGTLIGSALATDDPTGTDDGTGVAYCETFSDALASELGVTIEELVAAGKAAANATLDAAVDAGDLTAERADALRERIEEADGSGCGLFKAGFARGFAGGAAHGWAHGVIGGDVFEAAAEALGIESSDLIGQLRDAGSLEALAEELGASYDEVKASVLEAVQADLDAAVAEGLSQERADAVIERLTAWLDDGGEVGRMRLERGAGAHGPGGPFGPFGPWGEDEVESEDAGA